MDEELNELGWCVCNCENKTISLIASHDDICELSLANNDCLERLKRAGICPSCQTANIPADEWETRALIGDTSTTTTTADAAQVDALAAFDWSAERALTANEARVSSIDELRAAFAANADIDTLFLRLADDDDTRWINDIVHDLKQRDKLLSKLTTIR
jgi:hypothetical protein